ncbi:hypothetical protein [Clostridium brassicae]|uniref:Uncharacterized protein n=1 Tax=Clostridium brassicae TaxID=2999072 RepID=A0ABT4D6E7_9CLOT|nr:hypothetical protein [Clostridium brassicae]MCY6957852.1 hypothetical protein [Clostridium brassicae]
MNSNLYKLQKDFEIYLNNISTLTNKSLEEVYKQARDLSETTPMSISDALAVTANKINDVYVEKNIKQENMYSSYKVTSIQPWKMKAVTSNNTLQHLAMAGYCTNKELQDMNIIKLNRNKRRSKSSKS